MVSEIKNMVGAKCGRLLVLERAADTPQKQAQWLCRCDCGNTSVVRGSSLRSGRTQSCGCIKIEQTIRQFTTHGCAKKNNRHPLYGVWGSMKRRCYSPKSQYYPIYGGRGITVCDEWINDFSAFFKWALEHGYKKGLQLDRIDNDGNYEPDNCRFATSKTNNLNRRSNHLLEINGETKTIQEWAEESGIARYTIFNRWKSGKRGDDLIGPLKKPWGHPREKEKV